MQYFNEKFEDCVTIGASFSSSSVTMALPNTQYNPNYVAPEETAEIAVVAAEKAKKGPDIKWTDDNLRRFLEQVDKNKAYLAEPGATVAKGNTIGQKFDVIAIYLSTLPAFAANIPIQGAALKKKWDRERTFVATKYALDKEGANLSGLEDISILDPNEKFIYSMVISAMKYGEEKEVVREKDKKRENTMLTHESNLLQKKRKSVGGKLRLTIRDDQTPAKESGNHDENGKENENPLDDGNEQTSSRNPSSTQSSKLTGDDDWELEMKKMVSSYAKSEAQIKLEMTEKEAAIRQMEAQTEATKAAAEQTKVLTNMMLFFMKQQQAKE